MTNKKSNLTVNILQIMEQSNKAQFKPEEISSILGIDSRSARYALNLLHEDKLVQKIPDMEDLRSYYYFLRKKIPKGE